MRYWDVSKLKVFVDGVEIEDLVKAGYTADREHTAIETTDEIAGFNVKYARPTGTITVKATCPQLKHLHDIKNRTDEDYYKNGVQIIFDYTGVPRRKITFNGAMITKISHEFAEEAGDIDVEFVAQECVEQYEEA